MHKTLTAEKSTLYYLIKLPICQNEMTINISGNADNFHLILRSVKATIDWLFLYMYAVFCLAESLKVSLDLTPVSATEL
jgi:hypothetical protein